MCKRETVFVWECKESECVYVCEKERDSLCKRVSVCGRKNENEFIKIERCRWC